MENTFKKICYDINPFCSLHHVYGYNVELAYSKGLHYDTALTVAYFKKCTGSICIEGNRYTLCDGDMIILNYDELHSVNIDSESYCERLTLFIKEQIISGFFCDTNDFFSIFHNRRRGYENYIPARDVKKYGFDKTFSEILGYAECTSSAGRVLGVCKAAEILAKLGQSLCDTYSQEPAPYTEKDIIHDVIKYIDSNLCTDMSCDSIAKSFHISKYHLSHIFRSSIGISLWDYVIIRRLFRYNELIRKGHCIKEAYLSVGFKNYSNFYRLYKKHMKISPQEFKNLLSEN